jgi:hypothetical protein
MYSLAMPQKPDDRYTKKEAEQRMRAALKGARIAGHKPMKEGSPAKAAARPKPEKSSR